MRIRYEFTRVRIHSGRNGAHSKVAMHYAKAATRTPTNTYSTLLSSGVFKINFVDLGLNLHGANQVFFDLSGAINPMRSSEIHLNNLSTKEAQPRQKMLAPIRTTCYGRASMNWHMGVCIFRGLCVSGWTIS